MFASLTSGRQRRVAPRLPYSAVLQARSKGTLNPLSTASQSVMLLTTSPDAVTTGTANQPLDAAVPALLATIRNTLGMDVSFVSEFVGDQRVLRHVVPASGAVIAAGDSDPLESSWCKRVADGRLPRYIPDTSVHYARGDIEAPPFPIGTHLSVPIVLADGRTFGTLCCFSFERRCGVRENDLSLLHSIARLLATIEDRRRAASGEVGETRSGVAAAPLQEDVASVAAIDAVPQMLEVICRTTGMGFAAIARVTDSQWMCCASRDEINFGLHAGGELKLETTICNEIRQHHEPVVIEDVAVSGQYRLHHTPALYGFRSYISFPIKRKDGTFWGTLCAIDPQPATIESVRTRGMFKLFSDLVSFHLEADERLRASELALQAADDMSRRREQFVAALGHDIRTPLQAISGGVAVLARMPDQATRVAPMMQRSVGRISELVQDLMDLARGQLGTGMRVAPVLCTDLPSRLQQIVDETTAGWPDTLIEFESRIHEPVWCDPARIEQVAANLLANAVSHGLRDKLIKVVALTDGDGFQFSCANMAPPMSPVDVGHLFRPYFRPATDVGSAGLGLGLYIVSEIAKAHGGHANATAQGDELVFTVRIPRAATP